MGLRAEVQAILLASVLSTNVRYQTLPAGVVGIAIADDQAWDEIFDSTVVTVDYWIAGYMAVILNVAADFGTLIDIGTGGADGAAAAAATTVVTNQPLFEDYHEVTGVGVRGGRIPQVWLPAPIRVAASTRVAARQGAQASPTGTDVIDQFYVTVITGLGT